jgi:tRNA(Ile)-lysidine synthase
MSREQGLYARWALEVRRAGFFEAGERVGVAVSGGPDSMLLLDFMIRFARQAGLKLAVVHFNHHLRGPESEADQQFVREQAEKAGVEFLRSEANVARVARVKRKNLEATARELRYRFFFSLVNRGRLDKVATAHTASDQAETVLLRLVRGSGARGLGGIHPVLDGRVVRPFLTLTRAEVEAELARRQVPFRTDPSNQDLRFARNRVRQRVMPLLEQEFNPRIVRSLADLADRARDDEAFLEEQARERSLAWLTRDGEALKIAGRSLKGFPPAIARRVLRQMLLGAGVRPGAITFGLLESLRRLAGEGQSGRRLAIAPGLEARKEFEWLIVGRAAAADQAPDFAYSLTPPTEIAIPQLGLLLRFRLADISGAESAEGAYTDGDRVGLDSDRLADPLTLRNWRPGDRLDAPGSKQPLKVKELFQMRRIPPGDRPYWPVLESGGAIVWVRGFPPAATVRISGGSVQQLLIEEEPLAPQSDRSQES